MWKDPLGPNSDMLTGHLVVMTETYTTKPLFTITGTRVKARSQNLQIQNSSFPALPSVLLVL